MEERLELRMYFFTIYQLSGIQKAIQAGHSALEYAHKYGSTELFIEFIQNWKTWVILNGGTTNYDENVEFRGSLNLIYDELKNNKIDFAYFSEPDLNDAMTAICFICDERVFNRKNYPDFVDYITDIKMYPDVQRYMAATNIISLKIKSNEELQQIFPEYYNEWVNFVGGEKNVYLRELIKNKKLV